MEIFQALTLQQNLSFSYVHPISIYKKSGSEKLYTLSIEIPFLNTEGAKGTPTPKK
jgi:hypothetical protein